jgi:hypothetical protein
MEILKTLDTECQPLSINRIGRMTTSSNRLIKVVLPSSSHQTLLLNKVRQLKKIPKFKQLHIRPSLNVEDRKQQFQMREECRRLNSEGPKVRIYQGKITPLLVKASTTDHNFNSKPLAPFPPSTKFSAAIINQSINNWSTSNKGKSVSTTSLDSSDSWRTIGFK